MKRLWLAFLFLFVSNAAFAQYSNVTASVVDSDNISWNNGTYTLTFVPPVGYTGTIFTFNGTPWTPTSYSGVLNGSGNMAATVERNDYILPAGSKWVAKICPKASYTCSNTNVTINSATQNISSSLSLNRPRFPASNVQTGSYGYADVEVSPIPAIGFFYFNVNTNTYRIWGGLSWIDGWTGAAQLGGDVQGLFGSTVVKAANGLTIPSNKIIVGTNSLGQIIDASGALLPNSVSGNSATATRLLNVPLGCSAGQFATSINTDGSANCVSVNYSMLTGIVPTWNQNTTGTASHASNLPTDFATQSAANPQPGTFSTLIANAATLPFSAPNAANIDIPVADPNGNGACSITMKGGIYSGSSCFYKPLLWILYTGQSLATGNTASPALTTTQPYSNVMLTSDVGGNQGPSGSTLPLIPLVEGGTGWTGNVNVETASSSMANFISASMTSTLASYRVGVGLHGKDGTVYSGLAKGTPPFARGTTQLTNAATAAKQLGLTFRPAVVTVTHGEGDYPANYASYEGYLYQWQQDYLSTAQTVTPSISSLPFVISQMNVGAAGELAQAQWQASKDYPGLIYLCNPKYFMLYNSGGGLHINNVSQKLLGEYYGKCTTSILRGKGWTPLQMASTSIAGTQVTVGFNIPVTPLVIDTTTVAARSALGFEFHQTGGNAVTVSSASQSGNNMLVNLSAVPTGANQYIRYAWTCPNGSTNCGQQARTDTLTVGGNIRDSDTTVNPSITGSGTPLYNWLVAGQIGLPSVPDPPTLGTMYSDNASAEVSYGTYGISGYPVSVTVTSSPGGFTATGTTSPITVTGLTNGTTYTFTGTATNAYGTSAASAASGPVTPSLVTSPNAYYALAGNYNDTSATGNNFNGTAGGTGNSFTTDGVHGTVLTLNTAGWVNLPQTEGPSYTQAAWVNMTSGTQCIVMGSATAPIGSILWATNYQGTSTGAPSTTTLRGGGGVDYAPKVWDTTAFPTGTWVHVAISYDSSTGQYTLYKNGTQIMQATGPTTSTGHTGLEIGALAGGNGCRGSIAKVYQYNKVLLPSQVAQIAAIN